MNSLKGLLLLEVFGRFLVKKWGVLLQWHSCLVTRDFINAAIFCVPITRICSLQPISPLWGIRNGSISQKVTEMLKQQKICVWSNCNLYSQRKFLSCLTLCMLFFAHFTLFLHVCMCMRRRELGMKKNRGAAGNILCIP